MLIAEVGIEGLEGRQAECGAGRRATASSPAPAILGAGVPLASSGPAHRAELEQPPSRSQASLWCSELGFNAFTSCKRQ